MRLSTCQEMTSTGPEQIVPDNTAWMPLAVRFIKRHWEN